MVDHYQNSVVTFTGRQSRTHKENKVIYAGFWRRFAAWCIDKIIISFALYPLLLILISSWHLRWGIPKVRFEDGFFFFYNQYYQFSVSPYAYWLLHLFSYIPSALYFVLFHASRKQATLGMMALGLKITDYEGCRITFVRALGRYLASFVTALTCGVGYLMIVFTRRKQALHDIISETYIISSKELN